MPDRRTSVTLEAGVQTNEVVTSLSSSRPSRPTPEYAGSTSKIVGRAFAPFRQLRSRTVSSSPELTRVAVSSSVVAPPHARSVDVARAAVRTR